MKTSGIFFFVGVAGVLTVACSSGSSDVSCGNFSSASTLNGNATLSSGGTGCPMTVPLTTMSGTGAADAGAGGPCAPVVNGCTATVNCSLTTSGIDTMINATINASGMNFTGEETVSLNIMGTMVSCKYNLSGTFS